MLRTTGLVCVLFALLASIAASTGCRPSGSTSDTERGDGVIRTTFYPTQYFAERIAGGAVVVECPLPDGEDPATWRPSAEAVNAYQNASIAIVNGSNFEKWVITAPLPRSRVVDTGEAIERPIVIETGETHSHGAQGLHTHKGIDGHTWVDPTNALSQAEVIYDAMVEWWPEHEESFRAGFAELKKNLTALEAELGTIDASGVTLLAAHPAYNYLARRRGWEITNFDLDPDAPAANQQLMAVRVAVDEAASGQRLIMLWESAPIEATREALSSMGVESVVFAPVESKPAEGDYVTAMRANIERLKAAIGG
ncbi:MAG: hypothetical protein CMJ31_13080 [Phycisphaerae bacterium]|nr:hypothetical protein [Phycisphaerae bacterium]